MTRRAAMPALAGRSRRSPGGSSGALSGRAQGAPRLSTRSGPAGRRLARARTARTGHWRAPERRLRRTRESSSPRSGWSPPRPRTMAVRPSVSESEETLDLVPDGDGQRHARDEKDQEREPEPDPGPPRSLPMLRPGLPASAMQAYGIPNSFMVDDGDVVRSHLTHLLCHGVNCRDATPAARCSIL